MKTIESSKEDERIVGRLMYFLINSLPPFIGIAVDFSMFSLDASGAARANTLYALSFIGVGVFYTTSLYRLRDASLSKWWMIAVIFPLTSVIAFFALCFVKQVNRPHR